MLCSARVGRGYRISLFDLQEFWTSRVGGFLFGLEHRDLPNIPSSHSLKKAVAPKLKDVPWQLSLLDLED